MNPIFLSALLSALVLSSACTKESAAAPKVPAGANQGADGAVPPDAAAPTGNAATAAADLPKLLSGITDAASAEAAKPPLEAIVQQLESAKAAPAEPAKDPLSGGLGKLAGEAAAKLGVSQDTMAKISSLLSDPAIKAAIGPTLEKLQGLLK